MTPSEGGVSPGRHALPGDDLQRSPTGVDAGMRLQGDPFAPEGVVERYASSRKGTSELAGPASVPSSAATRRPGRSDWPSLP